MGIMAGEAQEAREEIGDENLTMEITKKSDRENIRLDLSSGEKIYSKNEYKQLKKALLEQTSYSWQELELLNTVLTLELTEKPNINVKNLSLKEYKKALLTEEK